MFQPPMLHNLNQHGGTRIHIFAGLLFYAFIRYKWFLNEATGIIKGKSRGRRRGEEQRVHSLCIKVNLVTPSPVISFR